MSSKQNPNIHSSLEKLEELLKFEDVKEIIELKASLIQLDILSEVKKLMKEKNISRAQMAESLNISKSFISQLFSGDKLLNLKMIAQLREIFDAKFISGFKYYKDFNRLNLLTKDDYNIDPDYEKRELTIHNSRDYQEFKAA